MGADRRLALITGASAGIGAAFADVFAAEGWDLVVTARRRDRLEALAARLSERHGTRVHVIPVDLADSAGALTLFDAVRTAGLEVDALVNNAGYGVPGSYRSTAWQQQAEFLQVLVTAVCELSHRVLPGMIDRRYGRILNVASLAGLLPGMAGHTLYTASKAFVIRFSQSLALETRKHGVHVTAVCPGFTYTEFHDVTGQRAAIDRLPGFMLMNAGTVARQGYAASMAGKVVHTTGWVNRSIALLAKAIPENLLLRILMRQNVRRQ